MKIVNTQYLQWAKFSIFSATRVEQKGKGVRESCLATSQIPDRLLNKRNAHSIRRSPLNAVIYHEGKLKNRSEFRKRCHCSLEVEDFIGDLFCVVDETKVPLDLIGDASVRIFCLSRSIGSSEGHL